MSYRKCWDVNLTKGLNLQIIATGGSHKRGLETRFEVIENMKVARDRNGEFYPRVLERYQRREEKIDQRVIELFIGGISTRKDEEDYLGFIWQRLFVFYYFQD